MKKVTSLFLILLLTFTGVVGFAEENVPQVASKSAILVQEGTGRILFEKNADEKVYPASTTKIMTAVLALEALKPTDVLTASEEAIQIDRDGSNMGILYREELTVEQLLYGLLVHSANDAANVLAEAVSGTIPAFIEEMNAKAQELGMTDTHFVNTHGYHDPDHYTTARDMVKLSMYAMQNELFRTIVATPTLEMAPTNRYEEIRYLSSNNALLNPMKGYQYIYEGAKGIKTGHTKDAGYCLASYAERNGLGFFCVTMGSEVDYEGNDSFIDTIHLFDYGFEGFKLQTVSNTNEIVATKEVKWGKGDDQAVLSAKELLEVLLPRDYDKDKLTQEIYVEERLVAPVEKGDILGRAEYFYDGQSVGSVDLVATRRVPRSIFKMVFQTLWQVIFNVWVMVPLAVLVLVLILRSMYEARKQRLARERRRQQFRKDFYNR